MTNEATTVHGAFVQVIASESIAAAAVSSASSSVAAALSAAEEIYGMLDFKLGSDTAHTAGDTVDLYRRPSDGSEAAPVPTASYLHQYVGTFTLNGTTGTFYYLHGVANLDPEDTFYLVSGAAATESFTLDMRARTVAPAA